MLGIQYNIAKANRTDRRVRNLASYINEDTLRAIHKTMDKDKAYGIDKVTKEEYGRNLEENLANLVKRMKNGSYHPNPTRSVYIPKETNIERCHLEQLFKRINAKLRGHYQYYGVTDNTREVKNFFMQTKWLLLFPLLEPSIKVSLFYR